MSGGTIQGRGNGVTLKGDSRLEVTGGVILPEGTEMVMPGDNVEVEVNLMKTIACEEGLKFAIREGGRTVGAGVVTKIIE